MKVCHSVPCSIDYTGKAGVDAYFQPTPVGDAKQTMAASLRGRGLLATPPTAVQGRVYQVSASNTLKQTNEFTHLYEWQHEHSPDVVHRNQATPLQQLQRWQQVAEALHGNDED